MKARESVYRRPLRGSSDHPKFGRYLFHTYENMVPGVMMSVVEKSVESEEQCTNGNSKGVSWSLIIVIATLILMIASVLFFMSLENQDEPIPWSLSAFGLQVWEGVQYPPPNGRP